MKKEAENNAKWPAVLSFIFSLITIIVFIYCYSVSGGSFNENGRGAVWWFLVLYYCTFGIPILVMSIIFGVMGLKSKLSGLAVTSLIIKAVTILSVVIWIAISFAQ